MHYKEPLTFKLIILFFLTVWKAIEKQNRKICKISRKVLMKIPIRTFLPNLLKSLKTRVMLVSLCFKVNNLKTTFNTSQRFTKVCYNVYGVLVFLKATSKLKEKKFLLRGLHNLMIYYGKMVTYRSTRLLKEKLCLIYMLLDFWYLAVGFSLV